MWALFQAIRRNVKLGITIFIWDLLLLAATLTVTAGVVKAVMHPAIPIIGVIWVLATAAAIWHAGGVEIDALFFARFLKMEMGKEFTHALNIFFMLGATTVIFFSLFPVWKFWAASILLPLILVGIFTSANLADKKTDWLKFRTAYLWLTGIVLAILAMAGVADWLKVDLFGVTPEIIRSWFSGWVMRLPLLGGILLALSFIPKIPKFSGLLKLAGVILMAVTAILLIFPELQPSSTPDKGMGAKNGTNALRAPLASSNNVVFAPRLPDGARFVKTLAPGEVAMLTRKRMDIAPPERWTRSSNGVVKEPPWPPQAQSRGIRNNTAANFDLFVVLPEGQGIEGLPEAPVAKQATKETPAKTAHAVPSKNATPTQAMPTEPAKKIARETTAKTPTPPSPPQPAAALTAPAAADPFGGKYHWNGQVGYPEDR